jgi:hypothetical protein
MSWLSPAVLWGLGAALPAVLAEYLYRAWPGSWASHLWAWVPLQLTIGYCIYRLVRIPNTTLLDAFVVWAFSTTALRVFVTTVLLGDTIQMGTWVAMGLLVLARVSQTYWRAM